MAIVQPGRPDPTQTAGAGGQIGASEAAPSESGMGLGALFPAVPLRPPTEHLAFLDEPSGAFAPPSPCSNGPVPKLEIAPPAAISPATAPPRDNFDSRFERVLA